MLGDRCAGYAEIQHEVIQHVANLVVLRQNRVNRSD